VNDPATRTPDPGLRLAFVLWSGGIGGAETFVAALVGVLRASGVDASVVILRHAEPLAERLRQGGIPFSELAFARGRAALWHPRRFADAVSRAGPDGAVLAAGGFLPLALRLGGYRRRIVAVEHGSVLQTHRAHRRPRPTEGLDRLLGARAVDVHVAVSGFLRGHLRSGSRPIVTIPNGVDLDLYRPPPASTGDTFVIGCMSRLFPGKGVEDVLVAAQAAISRGALLRIAGDGPMRSQLEQLADRLGIEKGVSFDGWIRDAPGVAAFWRECDVAITAPNDWVESFGLVAVEAMACGRPVVATRGGALDETVVHGRTGFLVKPGDTDALSTALLRYLDDDTLLAAHGAAARTWCEEQFDIRRCAADYVRLFRGQPTTELASSELRRSEGFVTRPEECAPMTRREPS
jgi:glycosyltransferase involved in cell wall biosynthesis